MRGAKATALNTQTAMKGADLSVDLSKQYQLRVNPCASEAPRNSVLKGLFGAQRGIHSSAPSAPAFARIRAAQNPRYVFSAPSCSPFMYQRWAMLKATKPGVIAIT